MRVWLLTIFLTVILAALASAQSQDATRAANSRNRAEFNLEKGATELGVWASGSFHEPTLIGTARERKLLLVGFRYGRVLGGTRDVAVEYTADVIPLALVFQPDFARQLNQVNSRVVGGSGFAPIGFRFIFNRAGRRARVKPFVETSGGFLYTARPVPVDIKGATHFNLSFDFGGGAQIFTKPKQAISFGYKFHHLSNAYRSRVNPGMDHNLFYIGYSFFK